MFESYDWAFEDINDINDKEIHSHSLQCQNKEEISFAKQHKVDENKASSFTRNTFYTNDKNPSYNSKSNVSRENLLLGIFQENTYQEISEVTKGKNKCSSYIPKEVQYSQLSKRDTTLNLSPYKNKISNEKSHIKSVNRVELEETKWVRIFPGPAGLVTQVKTDNSIASYLNNIKESENKIEAKSIKTNTSKTQDEKNLFSEKAWKLLMNDLPSNFLNEYGISTIKNRANISHHDSMKIKFIAGILDYIDHNYDDPFIILKDSTGSIEGTIHRDIPLNYPGVLEPNIVILLHNVGLLKVTTSVMVNKYHILVSQVNLLAIYSNKGQIVCTSHMENIFSNIFNDECVKNCDFNEQKLDNNCDNMDLWTHSFSTSSDNMEFPSIKNPLLHQSSVKYKSNKQSFTNNSENFKATNKIFESFEHSVDTGADINFTTKSEFISNKQKCSNQLPYKTVVQTSKVKQCKAKQLQRQEFKYLQDTRKKCTVNLKDKIKQNTSQISQIFINDTVKINDLQSKNKICELQSVNSSENSLNFITDKVYENTNINIKIASPVIKCNVENSKSLVSYFTGENSIHCNNEYDSDDEMLSQLDMDSISK